jgi:sirohydrochlorin ferrochelatase
MESQAPAELRTAVEGIKTMRQFLALLAALVITGCASFTPNPTLGPAVASDAGTGFLLAAPDRGAMGNDRVRLAFKALSEKHPAQLVFITNRDSAKYVDQALERLEAEGAAKAVVLPLFLSRANPKFNLLTEFLSDHKKTMSIQYARAFGDSYLAVEMLADRLQRASNADVVVIAGSGAADAQSREAITHDLNQLVHKARQGVFEGEVKTVIWPVRGAEDYETLNQNSWRQVRASKGQVQLVPFHMGMELDSMMSFNAGLRYAAPEGVKQLPTGDDELEWFSLWMQREINRYTALEEGSVGIVFNAHGANFHWNQAMRDATLELAGKYPIEYAFSMGDPPSLRSAVKRLEERGVGAIVIVRVFGMESSFRNAVEQLIGRDVESPVDDISMGSHGSHGGSMNMGARVSRLKTASIVVTAGGLQDDPLFAEALLDRAREISTDPANETIIVVSHGQGGDHANEAWLDILASLTDQMKQSGGDEFREILYQTWREDWPDKNAVRILSVREMVMAAEKDGGIALIIPARTTGRGPADRYLEGLHYRAGTGFAPHPLFPKWIEQQVDKGAAMITVQARQLATDDTAYLAQLGLIRGHLNVATDLYQQGAIDAAKMHMKHPTDELYTALVPAFDARDVSGFAEQLERLAALVKQEASWPKVKAAHLDLETAIEASATGASAANVRTRLKVVVQLVRTAAEEYEVGVKNGTVIDAAEYQDALGFVRIAGTIVDAIDAGSDDNIKSALGKIKLQLQGIKPAWPGAIAPEKIETDSSLIHDTLAKIEIAAGSVK